MANHAGGRRHDLPLINLMTATASMESIPEIPTKYQGLDRYDARRLILADLDAEGMLVQEETLNNVVPHGDRSGVVIEPWLMNQWYVNAEKMAQPAIKAVEDGRTTFVPERWNKTYFEWMRNIQPWCISRQLKLARNTPRLDIAHPFKIGLVPTLRHKCGAPIFNGFDRWLRHFFSIYIPLVH